jgi:hypothetical protein
VGRCGIPPRFAPIRALCQGTTSQRAKKQTWLARVSILRPGIARSARFCLNLPHHPANPTRRSEPRPGITAMRFVSGHDFKACGKTRFCIRARPWSCRNRRKTSAASAAEGWYSLLTPTFSASCSDAPKKPPRYSRTLRTRDFPCLRTSEDPTLETGESSVHPLAHSGEGTELLLLCPAKATANIAL